MSGLIPQHFINDLIDRADITEVLGKRIQLIKAGKGELKALCPFHDEKTPSFTVSEEKGFYHCFGCGAHGTVVGFLMDYEHMSFIEAIENLSDQMGIEIPRDTEKQPVYRYKELFELTENIKNFYQKNLRNNDNAVKYLKKRGINGATAKRYNIGFASEGWSEILDKYGTSKNKIEKLLSVGLIIQKDDDKYYDRFRNRLIFPIRDHRGRCIGFGGRVIDDSEPKYLNSPETVLFHKGQELYGLFEAKQKLRRIENLLIVEGYMDVIGLAQHGINYAVATLGTATTEDHFKRLFRLSENITFCFDGDRAGHTAAWRALQNALPHLSEGRQIAFAFLPKDQDPDSYIKMKGQDSFKRILDKSLPLSEFLIEKLISNINMKSIDGKVRLAEQARPLINSIASDIYKELLIEKLATSIDISAKKLNKLLLKSTDKAKKNKTKESSLSTRKISRNFSPTRPSIVRKAITIILNFPQSSQNIDINSITEIQQPGVQLLYELIKTSKKEPKITTAGLIERWRDDKEGKHLGKLAAMELPEHEDFNAMEELKNCINQLIVLANRKRIHALIEKEKQTLITDKEKTELLDLIKSSVKK